MHENLPTIVDANPDTRLSTYQAPKCQDGSTIEALILEFVKAKIARTQSAKTAKTYFTAISQFREFLRERGYDLIMYTQRGKQVEKLYTNYAFIRARIAECATEFSLLSKKGGFVSEATRNQRLSVLSSFYTYADKHAKVPFSNPIVIAERSPADHYGHAIALEIEQVRAGLAKIERSTLVGKRDYALLQVLLNTGGRVSQVQQLTIGSLLMSDGNVTIHFKRMKGAKSVVKSLDEGVSTVLLEYLTSYYGKHLDQVPATAPVWVVLTDIPAPLRGGKPNYQKGDPLKYQAIRNICQKYLGVSKVHTTRHTFSYAMMQLGASTEELQEELNHTNIAVTQVYSQHLKRKTNKHSKELAKAFGLEE